MSPTFTKPIGAIGLALATLLLQLAIATPALAADPVTMELQSPGHMALGKTENIVVVLRDSKGAPVARATILLWTPASFLSTSGAITLGEATTDAQGKATFAYEARMGGTANLNALFSGDARYQPAQAVADVTVDGSAQLYQSTAGVRLPGISVWLLVAALGVAWSIYFLMMVFLTLIARAGTPASGKAGGTNV